MFKERLSDRTPVIVRAIGPADRDRILDFFNRLSEQSRYHRFHGPKQHLTDEELIHFSSPDFQRHVGVAVTLDKKGDERFIGVGRYFVTDSDDLCAEVSLAVADDYHRRRVGSLLLRYLSLMAQGRGLSELTGRALSDNVPLLRLLANQGFALSREDGDVVGRLALRARRPSGFEAAVREP